MRNPTIALLLAALCGPTLSGAQGHPPAHEGAASHHDASLPKTSFEVMGSEVFRTAAAIVPIGHRLTAELHYFGLPDPHVRINVAQMALAWQFPLGRHGFIAPGLGYYSGVDHATFSGSVRWLYERGPFITEGLLVQGHDQSDETERGQIWDGNHVSLALFRKRLELGPTWEHIAVREEDEWKVGGRVAARVHPRLLAQLYVLRPGPTEWRLGFLVR